MAWGLDLIGDKELVRRLNALPDRVAVRVVKRAATKAARAILTPARRNARQIKDRGYLARSLGVNVRENRRRHVVGAYVGPRKGPKYRWQVGTTAAGTPVMAYPSKYAHLVEFGTAPHQITVTDPHRTKALGRVMRTQVMHPGAKPQPFLRTAFDAHQAQAMATIESEVRRLLEAEAAKP